MKIKFYEYQPEPGNTYTLVLENNIENLTAPNEIVFDIPNVDVLRDVSEKMQLYTDSGEFLEYRAHLNECAKWYIDIFGYSDFPFQKRFSQLD